MHRLLFEKTGNAVWISHLDLMRVFQRAFKRAGLPLTHTQGFNPRPSVSIALPLSVGVESVCELLDFELDGESTTCEDMRDRLNGALIEGVRVREVYDTGRKLKELSYLHCAVTFEYDSSIPEDAERKIGDLFKQTALIVPKKGKNGVQDQDVIPMIRSLEIKRAGEQELLIDCIICCQNPTLNPAQLAAAVKMYLPEMSPDFACCKRLEILDSNGNVFR
jgi:radical SAM-linked protein